MGSMSGPSNSQLSEDVTCPICYESLLHARDSLGDCQKLAAIECGHVFHEVCILKWFSQVSIKWYREQMERYGGPLPPGADGRPITPLHAKVECPTCRTKPSGVRRTIRLFFQSEAEMDDHKVDHRIDRGGIGRERKRDRGEKGREKEVMDLARRARDLEAGIRDFRPSNDPEKTNMFVAVNKSEEIVRDWDMIADETVETVAPYFERLRDAINDVRHMYNTSKEVIASAQKTSKKMLEDTLVERNIARNEAETLRKAVKDLTHEKLGLTRELDRLRNKEIPEMLAAAVNQEKQEKKEIAAALQASQMARQVEKTTWATVEKGYVQQIDRLTQQLQDDANERNEKIRLAKRYQEKAEKYKRTNEKIKAEILNLTRRLEDQQKAQLNLHPHSPPGPLHRPPPRVMSLSSDPIAFSPGDSGIGEESLLVDMPSIDDSFSFSPDSRAGPSRHPTARTFQFDLGDRHPVKAIKSRHKPDRKTTKDDAGQCILKDKENDVVPPVMRASVSPRKNLPDPKDIIIIPSSPDIPSLPDGPPQLKRTNPFLTEREDNERRKRRGMESGFTALMSTLVPGGRALSPSRKRFGRLR